MSYSDRHYGKGNQDCPTCHGIGWIVYDVPRGHEKFGKIFPCECRDDHSEATILRRAEEAGVGQDGWKLETDFWSLPGRQEMEKAIKAMAARIAQGDVSGWLTFVSGFGLGKSAMGEWLVLQAVKVGQRAYFMTDADLKRGISQEIERGDSVMLHRALEVPLLVVDQPDWLYDRPGNETYQINIARDLLQARYQVRATKATMLLLNLKAWNNRHEMGLAAILDRAEEGTVIISQAASVRSSIGQHVEEITR